MHFKKAIFNLISKKNRLWKTMVLWSWTDVANGNKFGHDWANCRKFKIIWKRQMTSRQFYQHFMSSFFDNFLLPKKLQTQTATLSYENALLNCWWNLHQGSISPPFYDQLLPQYSFVKKKNTKPNCNYKKAAQNTFIRKNSLKLFVKFTPRPNPIKL